MSEGGPRRLEGRILFVAAPGVEPASILRAIGRRLRPEQVGPLTFGGGPGDVEVFMLPVDLGQVGRLLVSLQLVAPVVTGVTADDLQALVQQSDGFAFVATLDPVDFEAAVSLADQLDRCLEPRRVHGLPLPAVFVYQTETTGFDLPLDVVDASLNPHAAPRFALEPGDERPLLLALKEIAKGIVRARRAMGDEGQLLARSASELRLGADAVPRPGADGGGGRGLAPVWSGPGGGEEAVLVAGSGPDTGEEATVAAGWGPDSGEEAAVAAGTAPDSGEEAAVAAGSAPDSGEEAAVVAGSVPESGEEAAIAPGEGPDGDGEDPLDLAVDVEIPDPTDGGGEDPGAVLLADGGVPTSGGGGTGSWGSPTSSGSGFPVRLEPEPPAPDGAEDEPLPEDFDATLEAAVRDLLGEAPDLEDGTGGPGGGEEAGAPEEGGEGAEPPYEEDLDEPSFPWGMEPGIAPRERAPAPEFEDDPFEKEAVFGLDDAGSDEDVVLAVPEAEGAGGGTLLDLGLDAPVPGASPEPRPRPAGGAASEGAAESVDESGEMGFLVAEEGGPGWAQAGEPPVVVGTAGPRIVHVGVAQAVSATAIEVPITVELQDGGSQHLVVRVDVRGVVQPPVEE